MSAKAMQRQWTDGKGKAKRETTTKERRERRIKQKAKSVALRESRIWDECWLFCASVSELCSTEVELFVLIKSSYSINFFLQFGKAWNRIFVGREFYNTFVFN